MNLRCFTFAPILTAVLVFGLSLSAFAQKPDGPRTLTNSPINTPVQTDANKPAKDNKVNEPTRTSITPTALPEGSEKPAKPTLGTTQAQTTNNTNGKFPAAKPNVAQSNPEAKPLVVANPANNASTNFTEGFIEAKGRCYIDRKKFPFEGQAEEMCRQGAEVMAKRNLLAQVGSVRIKDSITLVNGVFESQVTQQMLEGYIVNAYKVGDYVLGGDFVEVTMRVNIRDIISLYGKNNRGSARAMSTGDKSALENELFQALQAEGLTTNYNGAVPPLVLNIPENQRGNLSLLPTIRIKGDNGQVTNLDLSKYIGELGMDGLPQFLTGTTNLINTLGSQGVPILDGLVNTDGSISIDLGKQKGKGKGFARTLAKIGEGALRILPLVAAFL